MDLYLNSALKVARLIAVLGKVEGRTRLQKIVYLMKSKGYKDFSQPFMLHYFGPFSRQLANQLGFLCDAGLVEENEGQGRGPFVYTASSDAIKLFDGENERSKEQQEWDGFAKSLNSSEKSTEFLEALSTVVFLSDRGARGEALRTEFQKVKPHLAGVFEEARTAAMNMSLLN